MLDKSRSIRCIGNLRQLGSALNIYLSDNDGCLPAYLGRPDEKYATEQDWWHQVLPVKLPDYTQGDLPSIYRCPSQNFWSSTGLWPNIGYGYNHLGLTHPPDYRVGRRLSTISPSIVMAFADSVGSLPHHHGSAKIDWTPACPIDFRHNGRANICFVDGHVESKASVDIKPKNWGPES